MQYRAFAVANWFLDESKLWYSHSHVPIYRHPVDYQEKAGQGLDFLPKIHRQRNRQTLDTEVGLSNRFLQ
jgi:hypothetical protein